MAAIGVFVAIVFALVPVGVDFGADPLLRLRQLDPELSPPDTTAVCGSPVRSLHVEPKGTSLYELARSGACERAARRRLLAAVAAGSVIVMGALLGLAGAAGLGVASATDRPAPTTAGGIASG